jgi:hypothetical protein
MKNTLRVNHAQRVLVMDRTFAKLSVNVRYEEYAILQRARQDYPTYAVVTRRIKRNPNRETYAGLTYHYMENYILTHEVGDATEQVMREYRELRLISECHSKARRYPAIKSWFLKKYPEIEKFGQEKTDVTQSVEDESDYTVVMAPLAGCTQDAAA